MLFQYPDPPSTDPGCPSFPERSEGLFAPLSEAIQPGPNALHLDQRAGTFPAHHRSNQAVPSSSSQAAKAEEGESRYYKELTVRCTSKPLAAESQSGRIDGGFPSRQDYSPILASRTV